MEWFVEFCSCFFCIVVFIVIIIVLYFFFLVIIFIYIRNIGINLGLVIFVLKVMVNLLIIYEGNLRDILV